MREGVLEHSRLKRLDTVKAAARLYVEGISGSLEDNIAAS